MAVLFLFPRAESDLHLVCPLPQQWIVHDRRRAGGDSPAAVGLIERVSGRYEVLEYGDPLVFADYSTLTAAVQHFVIPAILTGDAQHRSPSPRTHRASA